MNETTANKQMPRHRKISLTAGLFYLLTFVSIPTLALYTSVKSKDYILSSGSDSAAIIGGILEITVALANIATGVVLYTILKRRHRNAALGFVATRTLEAALMFVGVAVLLTIVSMKQAGVGAEALPVGQALAYMYDRIFLVSQGFIPALNDILLGYMLYKTQLVPRALSRIGIVGGLVLIAGWLLVMFGVIGQHDSITGIFALPVAVFELGLGLWLVFKGFNSKAVATLDNK